VVDEGSGPFVGRAVELNEHSLDVKEIALEGIEVSAGLEMFRRGNAVEDTKRQSRRKKMRSWECSERRETRHSHGDPIFLDDISKPVPVCGDGAEPEQSQGRVTAI
jgi:hypothetical protein